MNNYDLFQLAKDCLHNLDNTIEIVSMKSIFATYLNNNQFDFSSKKKIYVFSGNLLNVIGNEDTLNLKLTEHKNDFICIVAGYPREIEDCFFSYNPGLKSRFPIKFTIEPYTSRELLKIFTKIVNDSKWQLDEKITSLFFKKHLDDFKYYGRDMEVLFTKCKRTHSMRLVQNSNAVKKIITLEDLESAFENFMLDR